MTSFPFTLYGQCCRLHIVDQRVISGISAIRSYRSICSLCSVSNNAVATPLLHYTCSMLICVLTSILHRMRNISCPATWWRVFGDHGLVTSLHFIYLHNPLKSKVSFSAPIAQNRCAIPIMFVCLSVWDGRALWSYGAR